MPRAKSSRSGSLPMERRVDGSHACDGAALAALFATASDQVSRILRAGSRQ